MVKEIKYNKFEGFYREAYYEISDILEFFDCGEDRSARSKLNKLIEAMDDNINNYGEHFLPKK